MSKGDAYAGKLRTDDGIRSRTASSWRPLRVRRKASRREERKKERRRIARRRHRLSSLHSSVRVQRLVESKAEERSL